MISFSTLYDENTFYQAFTKDLLNSQNEVIIESPFITSYRAKTLLPILKKLVNKGVKVYVLTRNPKEHKSGMEIQSENVIQILEVIGVQVLLCDDNDHRKLAILDRKVLWEGSLNILSQTRSREIMRRIDGKNLAVEMFNFLKLNKFL